MRGLFVTGTDTGAGKTVLAGAVAARLAAEGRRVAVFKPVVTGTDEPPAPGWPRDDELLAGAAGVDRDAATTRRYGPAVSPHLAAELAGEALDPEALVAAARRAAEGADVLVAEGVGGLLVPLAGAFLVRDLAAALGLPLLVAARPGLGTINHSLMTLEAARAAGLRVAAVVLTPWPSAPTTMQTSNRETIEALGRVPVATLPLAASGAPRDLAAAAAGLPLEEWLAVPGRPRAAPFTVTRMEEVDAVPWPGGITWHPVRAALGLRAFGTGGYTADRPGDVVVEPHIETADGRGHQELYVVLQGRATFALDGEDHDAPAGTLVGIPDPAVHRSAVATEAGTTVLALGGPPSFEPAGSEWLMRARPRLPGDPAGARAILEDGRAQVPGSPAIDYGFALLAAADGDDALARHLAREAIRRAPGLAAEARRDGLA